ncbi:AEC family transporter [Shewanella sp. JM162201]|uniref:AEC family transporter n=1 Tax=Shewanella jiangmenensis TaxID=2837387 RepID=A0ABS5UZ09_9GAMM|nr:AEC family transporter [Shewanella jiangmenensis]MBT1443388.1 AEC family transporter [Shewanella jiangmenensis]
MTAVLPLLIVIAIMAAGAASHRWCPRAFERLLNQYVYYLAFPAILFMSLKQAPFEEILNGRFILGYSAALLLVYALIYWKLCSKGQLENRGSTHRYVETTAENKRVAALHALAATFGNTAFIGIPLLAGLFPGNAAAMLAAALASLLSVLMFALTVVLLRLSRDTLSKAAQLWLAIRVCGKNPIVMGSLLGVGASAMQLSFPQWLESVLWGIGKSSSPCALFAIGVALARSARDAGSLTFPASLWQVLGAKLIILPTLVWVMFAILGVDNSLTAMAVLLAAMPSAASVYLLAYQDGSADKLMARIIVSGTLLSLIIVPTFAWLLL